MLPAEVERSIRRELAQASAETLTLKRLRQKLEAKHGKLPKQSFKVAVQQLYGQMRGNGPGPTGSSAPTIGAGGGSSDAPAPASQLPRSALVVASPSPYTQAQAQEDYTALACFYGITKRERGRRKRGGGAGGGRRGVPSGGESGALSGGDGGGALSDAVLLEALATLPEGRGSLKKVCKALERADPSLKRRHDTAALRAEAKQLLHRHGGPFLHAREPDPDTGKRRRKYMIRPADANAISDLVDTDDSSD